MGPSSDSGAFPMDSPYFGSRFIIASSTDFYGIIIGVVFCTRLISVLSATFGQRNIDNNVFPLMRVNKKQGANRKYTLDGHMRDSRKRWISQGPTTKTDPRKSSINLKRISDLTLLFAAVIYYACEVHWFIPAFSHELCG